MPAKLSPVETVARFRDFVEGKLEPMSEGVECEHDQSQTDSGVGVCTHPECPLAWADRVLVEDWHTATQEWARVLKQVANDAYAFGKKVDA